jgi:hypothetical protein
MIVAMDVALVIVPLLVAMVATEAVMMLHVIIALAMKVVILVTVPQQAVHQEATQMSHAVKGQQEPVPHVIMIEAELRSMATA